MFYRLFDEKGNFIRLIDKNEFIKYYLWGYDIESCRIKY